MTKIICLDFDGVLHSYTSGWNGATVIIDPPVEGALEWLAAAIRDKRFSISILSSRSSSIGSIGAMKKWLIKHYCRLAPSYDETPKWLQSIIAEKAFADPWEDEVKYAVKKLVDRISFPDKKPPAFITFDDRAVTFNGKFPSLDEVNDFLPWFKK